MAGLPPGWIVLGVLRVLDEQGPLTGAGLRRALGAEQREISSVICRMCRVLPTKPKRIYIKEWVRDDEGSTTAHPRAVYDIGDLPDAPRPKPNRAAVTKRCRDRKAARVSSVWEFAMPRRARQAREKQYQQERV
jgi:hypothetical protein